MLSMTQISKSFPGVQALTGVDFEIKPGEIHALVGANGAGKSTLMKILSGAYRATEGEIAIDGQRVEINDPTDAKKNGIVIVYQEVDTALVPHLSVAENIMMDRLVSPEHGLFVRWSDIYKEAQEVIDAIGLHIEPKQLISDLTLSQKQMVLLGRAVYQKAQYLLLDEPTAPLSLTETEKLFTIIEKLRKDGMGIVFISHRLDEVFNTCEKITVLRDGKLVDTYQTAQSSIDRIVEAMLGRKLENTFPQIKAHSEETLLEVKGLSGDGGIHGIDLHVKAGEIVGLTGLVGGGKTELCKLLFGEGKVATGEVRLKRKTISLQTPHDAVRAGIALVPEERRKEGVLVEESIATNLTLPTLSRYCSASLMRKGKIKQASEESIAKVGIKTPSQKQQVSYLSGGNQQKVVIGKWLLSDAALFLLDEPTKGVDVGSKSDIYALISELGEAGKGVLYASCEFSEVLGLTHRIYVMYNGTIVKELVTAETSEEELLFYSTGGTEFGK